MLAGCNQTAQETSAPVETKPVSEMSFEELTEAAKGTTVSFYGWGGDENLNAWLDGFYATYLKENYNITLDRVPMNIDEILSQLTGELGAGKTDGPIDMIWINGENFRTAKDNDMLFGPFLAPLPSYQNYIDQNADDITLDFGYPVDGYEAPYGKAQLVFYSDLAKDAVQPKNTQELLGFARSHPGMVTYPALPDFTGSAFVRNVIYDIVGYEQFMTMEADKETVKAAIEPALEYLRELNPYLWSGGKSYPSSSTEMENMYSNGELIMGVTYAAFGPTVNIENGKFPETTMSFQFDSGTLSNTNFIAIAKNSENPAGAMVAINAMMSPEVQANRFATLKTLPVVDYTKLDDAQKAAFDAVEIGAGAIPQDELLSKAAPEMPSNLVPIIEEIWLEEVAGK